jgi:phenylalanyl-tRNA synthetase beta chain
VHGIARDLAARGLGTLKPHAPEPVKGTFPCPMKVEIDADTLDVAPHFAGRLIRGVKNGPSPEWLQDRLRAIGLRPISALVDITNFFTYDMNRPLHVFDADKVHGTVRVPSRERGARRSSALDEKTYTFAPGTRDLRRQRCRKHRGHHGRRGLRLHRGDHQRLPRSASGTRSTPPIRAAR